MQGFDARKMLGLFLMLVGSACGLAGAFILLSYGLWPSTVGTPWGRILPLMVVGLIGIHLGRWLARIGPHQDGDGSE